MANKTKTCKKLRGTSSYNIWMEIKQRCYNPNNKRYKYYGGKGISLCKRWQTFSAFYVDMGEKPEKMSISRTNNDGDYEPSNCRWATYEEQNGSNVYVLHNPKDKISIFTE